jgi:hypothetical protein
MTDRPEHPVWYPTRAAWAILLGVWLLPPLLCSIAALGYIVERHRALDELGRVANDPLLDRFRPGPDKHFRLRELMNYQPDIVTCLRTGVESLPNAPKVVAQMPRYSDNGEPVFPLWWLVAGVVVYVLGLRAAWSYWRLRHRFHVLESVRSASVGLSPFSPPRR